MAMTDEELDKKMQRIIYDAETTYPDNQALKCRKEGFNGSTNQG